MAIVLSGLVRAWVIDDSFIAVRYASNLLAGHGLVFNAGERVEGFSDLLWTLLLTVPVSLGWRPELFAIVVGVLSGALAFYIAYRASVRVGGVDPLLALPVTLACMFNVDFWTTCTNGLESGLFALLAILSLVLWWEKRFLAAGAVLGILVFLRPEALMLGPLLAIAVVVERPRDPKRRLSFFWPWASLAVVSFLFRIAYFHALLPNSVTAKSHPLAIKSLVLGLVYSSHFASGIAIVLMLAIAAVFTRHRLIAAVALLWLTAQFLVVVMNGGDWMPGFRLLIVFLPGLTLAAVLGFNSLLESQTRIRLPATALLIALLVFLHLASTDPGLQTDWSFSGGLFGLSRNAGFPGSRADLTGEQPYIRLAQALQPVLGPDEVVSPEALGLFSYLLMPIHIHDFMGLTDRHVAVYGKDYDPTMGKSDLRYTVETIAPTLIIFHSGMEFPRKMQSRTAGEFTKRYVIDRIPGFMLPGPKVPLILAIRRDREPAIARALKAANIPLEPVTDLD